MFMQLKRSRKRSCPTTSIVEQKMPEAATQLAFKDNLGRIYAEGLPGFVIRSSGLMGADGHTNLDIVQAVLETMPEVIQPHNSRYSRYRVQASPIPFTEKMGRGELHQDMVSRADVYRVQVHKTISGAGKVTLANSGLDFANRFLKGIPSNLPKERYDAVEDDFKNGQVTPDIVDPTLLTATVSEGDFVVLALGIPFSDTHDNAGPVWHCFDTSTASRSGEAIVIEPAK